MRNVQRSTQFNRTGKLILRLAGLESINATVERSFPGTSTGTIYLVFLSLFCKLRNPQMKSLFDREYLSVEINATSNDVKTFVVGTELIAEKSLG